MEVRSRSAAKAFGAPNAFARKLHRLAGWFRRSKNKGRKMFASPFGACDDVFVSVSVRSDVLAEGELCFT